MSGGVFRGSGPATSGERVCPDFDTWGEFEMIDWNQGDLMRVARNGEHQLVKAWATEKRSWEIWLRCACGREFRSDEAQIRKLCS